MSPTGWYAGQTVRALGKEMTKRKDAKESGVRKETEYRKKAGLST